VADLAAIRAGIAANISAISDLQVSAYMLANPTPPNVQVIPGDTDYDLAMHRGLDELTMRVVVSVGLVADIGAQKNLDEYLAGSGPRSIKQAVESDPTLGGVVADVTVTAATGPKVLATEQGGVLFSEWTVQVLATG
jgi:hypothetical protein